MCAFSGFNAALESTDVVLFVSVTSCLHSPTSSSSAAVCGKSAFDDIWWINNSSWRSVVLHSAVEFNVLDWEPVVIVTIAGGNQSVVGYWCNKKRLNKIALVICRKVLHVLSVLAIRRTMQIKSWPTKSIIHLWSKVAIRVGDGLISGYPTD